MRRLSDKINWLAKELDQLKEATGVPQMLEFSIVVIKKLAGCYQPQVHGEDKPGSLSLQSSCKEPPRRDKISKVSPHGKSSFQG